MSVHNTREFMSNVGFKRGKYANLKKAGRLTGFLHPKMGFRQRQRHGAIPGEWEARGDDAGKVEIRNRMFNCVGRGCPICLLMDFADKALQDGADPDETILDGGREAQSYTLGEIAGRGSWKTDLKARQEYVVGFISSNPEEHMGENPVQVMTITAGLGGAIKRVIARQQENFGETKGDPMQTPYGFELVYDEKEKPANKYQAYYADQRLAPLVKEIQEIMQADEEALGVNLDDMVKPANKGDVLAALRSTWCSRKITYEMFLDFAGLSEQAGREPAREPKVPDNLPPSDAAGDPVCVECKKPIQAGSKFCPECGATQPGSAPPPASAAPAAGNKQKIKCPGCGEMVVPSRFGYCPNCNHGNLDTPF